MVRTPPRRTFPLQSSACQPADIACSAGCFATRGSYQSNSTRKQPDLYKIKTQAAAFNITGCRIIEHGITGRSFRRQHRCLAGD